MTYDIQNTVYGCLIGGAIGDALGAPIEGWTRKQITEEYGTFEEFKQYYMPYSNTEPGTITSDTAMRHYLCLTIVENNGRVSPFEFADILREHLNPDRVWITQEIILKKLSTGDDPWSTGQGTIPDNKAASAITPIGIVNAGNPRQAYQDGFNIASMLQDGYHRHMTATVAAGIAEAVMPNATIESVIATMVEHSTGLATRAIDIAMGFAEDAESVEALIDMLYEQFIDWRWPAVQWDREKYHNGEIFSASTLETVPVAVAILSLCNDDVNQSIIEGINYGRDSDAVGTIVGSLAGALHGADEIRKEWKVKCEDRNQDFFEEVEGDPTADFRSMTNRLIDSLEYEQEKTTDRHDTLSRLLDNGGS
ncbi:ADP-ribosylglycohydrolase family protein [Halalkalicoccus jeotgali]|uniref:ADP-ribosylation/Crystallin J1 n=1 Tax=Halalkalicoccus jeotgali (strain DSM 18796 / CECT 7217 / JCM 14584 / KCTC 4019 / B3) TaxID=795797 RepID=D8JBV3_HALJB|nr:ADP-ribosylglycohydrolase family protein [Halalkalicoccus jeotgali]ADJ16756.1 ADP-ribosylation/Crystallin J1 [Halalkalicoccus jeotgali B3]ELY40887.1 ADP-ribosylation/Crystallin J1 [Halalkalicoccus jeotgali B3]